MSVKIVTGWSDLGFQPTKDTPALCSKEQYWDYLERMKLVVGSENIHAWWDYPFGELYAVRAYGLGYSPDTETPSDRYATAWQHGRSNLVQHQRTTWALMAADLYPEVTTWIWLDCGILKQGKWRNNPVTEDNIKNFFDKVSNNEPTNLPFPGIAEKGTVFPGQNNWRFCGSTHIWPATLLDAVDWIYKDELDHWVYEYKTMPLDLPIWALVEKRSHLPFKWYSAEYDASQLENYPGE